MQREIDGTSNLQEQDSYPDNTIQIVLKQTDVPQIDRTRYSIRELKILSEGKFPGIFDWFPDNQELSRIGTADVEYQSEYLVNALGHMVNSKDWENYIKERVHQGKEYHEQKTMRKYGISPINSDSAYAWMVQANREVEKYLESTLAGLPEDVLELIGSKLKTTGQAIGFVDSKFIAKVDMSQNDTTFWDEDAREKMIRLPRNTAIKVSLYEAEYNSFSFNI